MKARITTIGSALGLIVVAAVLLRLLVFAYIAHEPRKFYTYDSDGYDRRAQNLLQYGVFSGQDAPPFTPDLRRTPGYPALLAAVFAVAGHRPELVILLQVLLGAATALLTFLLARELGLPPVAGLIAALIVAVDPVSVLMANRLLTETPFTALLVAALWLLVRFWRGRRAGWLIGAALLLALAALIRPVSQFLPLALLPLFALAAPAGRRRALLPAALLFAVVALGLTYAWAYRNYRQGGVFTLSTISDINLTYYRAREVLAAAEGTSQDEAWNKLEAQIARSAAERGLTPAQTSALERQEALAIFRAHPGLTAMMLARGVFRLLADPGYTYTCTVLDPTTLSWDCFSGNSTMDEPGLLGRALGKFGQMSALQRATLIWSVALLAIVYVGGALGALRLARERRWLALALPLLAAAYFVALSSGAEADSRFRTPIMPLLAILAGVGIAALIPIREARGATRMFHEDREGTYNYKSPFMEGFGEASPPQE